MVGRAGAGASLRGSSAALPVTAWGNKEMLLQHREGCSCEGIHLLWGQGRPPACQPKSGFVVGVGKAGVAPHG